MGHESSSAEALRKDRPTEEATKAMRQNKGSPVIAGEPLLHS